jgi:hypothetical protein
VANIFGGIIAKIQENMLKADIQQVHQYGDTFFSQTDTAYLIFIVHASGANTFLVKTTSFFMGSAQSAATNTVDGTGSVISATEKLLRSKQTISAANNSDGNQYMQSKLSGK